MAIQPASGGDYTGLIRFLGAAALVLWGIKKLVDYEQQHPGVFTLPPGPTATPLKTPQQTPTVALEWPPKQLWTPPSDTKWLDLIPHPSITLILGKRGSGKSALGWRILELSRNRAKPFVVGLPEASKSLPPEWIGYADRIEDVPDGATILMDESYLQFNARSSMSEAGRSIGSMVNLSRQKSQSLIFITQESRQLDINAISQADCVVIKELTELSREFERKELRRLTDKARDEFSIAAGNKQRLSWVYSEAAGGEVGLVENELPSFWRPAFSKAFSAITPNRSSGGRSRQGKRTSRAELEIQAKSLHDQGVSYAQIGKILGVSKTRAYELVNGRKQA